MLAKLKNSCIFVPLALFSGLFFNPVKPNLETATPPTIQSKPDPEPNPGLLQAEPIQSEASEATPPVSSAIQSKEELDKKLDDLKSQLGELADGEPKKRLERIIESARKIEPLRVEKGKKLDELGLIFAGKVNEISSLIDMIQNNAPTEEKAKQINTELSNIYSLVANQALKAIDESFPVDQAKLMTIEELCKYYLFFNEYKSEKALKTFSEIIERNPDSLYKDPLDDAVLENIILSLSLISKKNAKKPFINTDRAVVILEDIIRKSHLKDKKWFFSSYITDSPRYDKSIDQVYMKIVEEYQNQKDQASEISYVTQCRNQLYFLLKITNNFTKKLVPKLRSDYLYKLSNIEPRKDNENVALYGLKYLKSFLVGWFFVLPLQTIEYLYALWKHYTV